MPEARKPIVILGPTAGGKSELAAAICERLREVDGVAGEVISADSMQVYRQLDVGTAKPSASLRERVTHHLVDCVEPTEPRSVADWLAECCAAMADMAQRGARPVVAGGTNLYLKALVDGLMDGPGRDEAWRKQLAAVETTPLHRQLEEVDPAAAERIHANDRKRIIRALEVHRLTGKPISEQQHQWAIGKDVRCEDEQGDASVKHAIPRIAHRTSHVAIGLRWPAEAINPRINLRVKAMFYPRKVAEGDAENPPRPELAAETCPNGENLIAECRRLLEAGLLGDAAPQASEALGYKQVLAHLRGELSEAEAFEKTKVETRRFAKNQRTWFKRFGGAKWVDAVDDEVLPLSAEARLERVWSAVCEAVNS